MGTDEPPASPHELHLRLGSDPESRRLHYRNLFQAQMPEATIEEIREPANKARARGNERFCSRIEVLDQATPRPKGGDRKKRQAE
jgi:hypothetical protein